MLAPSEPSPPEVGRLAALHLECLPSSLVSWLGPTYLRALYAHVAASRSDVLFTERLEGVVVGAAVLCLTPETLSARLLTRTPALLFLPRAARAGWTARRNHAPPSARLAPLVAAAPPMPEVVWLFAAPDQRRSGIGRRLLERAEAMLATTEHRAYRVVTDASGPALNFYVGNGFAPLATVRRWGQERVVLRKAVAAQPT